jgi:hypothetical protein
MRMPHNKDINQRLNINSNTLMAQEIHIGKLAEFKGGNVDKTV